MSKGNAWAHALVWAGISYVVLLVVAVPRSDDPATYTAGRMLVPAMVCCGLVGLVAAGSTRRWEWWVFPLAVPAVAAVVAVAISLPDLLERDEGNEATGEVAAAGPVISEFSAPASQGKWKRIETAAARAGVEQAESGASRMGPGVDSVVAGFYRHGSSRVAIFFLGVNGDLGPGGASEQSMRSLMAGASVADYETYDAGDAGGLLGCGNAAAQGKEWFTCGWIGRERMMMLRWDDRSVTPEQAAALTTEFRSLATG